MLLVVPPKRGVAQTLERMEMEVPELSGGMLEMGVPEAPQGWTEMGVPQLLQERLGMRVPELSHKGGWKWGLRAAAAAHPASRGWVWASHRPTSRTTPGDAQVRPPKKG